MDNPEQLQARGENIAYVFGPFELNPNRGILLRNGVEIPLRHQCFEVLQYLVVHHGNLVTKQELMDAIWPDVIVTESSLPQCIFSIRKALDDDEKTIVRSIPRSGYLFDVPVTVEEIQAAGRYSVPISCQRNPTARPAWRAGVTFALSLVALLGLAQIGQSTLSAPFGDPIEAMTPAFSLADTGQSKLEAIRHYELGNFFYGRRQTGDTTRAVQEFRTAVETDPEMANAWVGLAGSLWLDSRYEGPAFPLVRAEFKAALETALELDPEHPEANARLAYYYLIAGNVEKARALFDRGLTNGRNNAWVLATAAGLALDEFQYQDAVELQRRAALLDPLSYASQSNLAGFLRIAGQLDEAIAVYQRVIDLAPGLKESTLEGLSSSYVLQGRYELAESIALQMPAGEVRDEAMALVYVGLDQPQDLNRMIERLSTLPGFDSAVRLAEIYAFAGNTERSLQWLDEARTRVEQGADNGQNSGISVSETMHSPFLRRLGDDPRWQDWNAFAREHCGGPPPFFDLVASNDTLSMQTLPD